MGQAFETCPMTKPKWYFFSWTHDWRLFSNGPYLCPRKELENTGSQKDQMQEEVTSGLALAQKRIEAIETQRKEQEERKAEADRLAKERAGLCLSDLSALSALNRPATEAEHSFTIKVVYFKRLAGMRFHDSPMFAHVCCVCVVRSKIICLTCSRSTEYFCSRLVMSMCLFIVFVCIHVF